MFKLRDIPSQMQPIKFDGLEDIKDLAHYTESGVWMGLAPSTKLKAVKFWISKKICKNAACDLTELS